jgi:excinuclease ABC subunit B
MYADKVTDSMRRAIDETYRRRRIQIAHNEQHGITPVGIKKAVRDIAERIRQVAESRDDYVAGTPIPKDELARLIKELESQMKAEAKDMQFEKAALLRDQIIELRRQQAEDEPLALVAPARR